MSGHTGIQNRKALVTGSVTGIGHAIAEALGEAGAGIVAHGLDAKEVREVAEKWRAKGFDTCESDADLGRPDGVNRLKGDLKDWGSPEIVVLNASIEIAENWDAVTLNSLEKQGMVNVWSSFLLAQAFLPEMLARDWGRIIAIGSVQESRPNARHIAYAATKAAQTSMMLNLARNLRAPNITFNILKPGVVATKRNAAVLSDEDRHRAILEAIPLGRLGTPEDCVGATLFLCSDQGKYINGAELHVDGGYRL